jgi:hypothetical protein
MVPQRALNSALQSAALSSQAAADAAEGAAQQTVGTLVTVTDEQGNMQHYFLPVDASQAAAAMQAGSSQPPLQAMPTDLEPVAAAAAAAGADSDVKPSDQQQQQVPKSPYQLRRRTAAAGQPDAMQVDEPQQQQQQAVAASPSRSLRSTAARTPVKQRSTPVKRKADQEEQQVRHMHVSAMYNLICHRLCPGRSGCLR